jgi:hypothetical protein
MFSPLRRALEQVLAALAIPERFEPAFALLILRFLRSSVFQRFWVSLRQF